MLGLGNGSEWMNKIVTDLEISYGENRKREEDLHE